MSSVIGSNICKVVNNAFDEIKPHPVSLIGLIPFELVWEVFSHSDLSTLGTICCVSKEWKLLGSDPPLWKCVIYRKIAFSNNKWAQSFGKDIVKGEDGTDEYSSLPWKEFIEDCKKIKSLFPEKNAKDCLMLVRLPKTLNGRLTLNSVGELAKKYFPRNDKGYKFINLSVFTELGEKSIDESCWILMMQDVLRGSKHKTYSEQQEIVNELAKKALIDYEIPGVLEAAVCIFSQYFDSNRRLFSDKTGIYTCCKDKVNEVFHAVIGGFFSNNDTDGLTVSHDNCDRDHIGVAARRKF